MLNVRLLGETLATGAVPVPLRFTVCGLLESLSVNVSVPVTDVTAVGLKVTFTVQLALAASEGEQLSVSANGLLATILVKPMVVVPVFSTVTGWELLVLTTTFPKESEEGLTVR